MLDNFIIRRIFFSIICIGFLCFSHANAEDGSKCEAACFDTHNLEIMQVTSGDHTYSYKIQAAKTDSERRKCEEELAPEICEKGGTLSCDESVVYPQFKYVIHHYGDRPDQNLILINQYIRSMAEKNKCDIDSNSVEFRLEQIYARANLISVVLYYGDYPRYANGSCHGNHKTMTFDTMKGPQPLLLNDIIKKDNYSALKNSLFSELKEKYSENFKSENDALDKSDPAEADKYIKQEYLEDGFFIENGDVKINIDDFIFSCANGNFIPLTIPDEFIEPGFLATLKSAREHD